jgi:hypothetical protein
MGAGAASMREIKSAAFARARMGHQPCDGAAVAAEARPL